LKPIEFEIQRAILGYLKAKKIFAKRMEIRGLHKGRKNPATGCPDIIGVLPNGRALMIEVKTKKGKLSEEQEDWLHASADAGALVVIATSLDDVINALEAAG